MKVFIILLVENRDYPGNFQNKSVSSAFSSGIFSSYSVHPISAGGVNLLSNFEKGGLDRTSTLRRSLLEKREVTFFRGGCNFYKKNKQIEMFNNKKVYKQIFFSVITKNSNWKILTKNLVTFKR